MTTILSYPTTTNSSNNNNTSLTNNNVFTPTSSISSPVNNNINHYSRRVSFNNISPDENYPSTDLEPLQPIYNNYTTSKPSTFTDHHQPRSIPDLLSNKSHFIPRKRFKLPDPPSKSILKNKVSQQQLEYNDLYDNIEDATINYHHDNDDEQDDSKTLTNTTPRRKSYADMTDEELLALDPQFNTRSNFNSNLEKFKFDNQKTYYNESRRSSVNPTTSLFKKQEYPTSNENNYKSINLTVKHDDYDSIQFTRTLLSFISGRKHSWNSLDWLLLIQSTLDQSFLIDGDYLIVSCLIPNSVIKDYNNKKRKTSLEDYLYTKCHHLLNYLLDHLNKLQLKLKLTLEFVLDGENLGNKFMFGHVFKQYQPNLLIIGNRSSNLNFKYPLQIQKSNYLIKLSSYIVKYSTVPTILVGQQHHHKQEDIEPKPGLPKITFSEDLSPKNSNQSSIESVESFTPKELTEDENNKFKFNQQWNQTESLPNNDESKFISLIKLISDQSYQDSTNYLSAINSKDESLKVDDRIHEIYRSQTWNYPNNHSHSSDELTSDQNMYKVKSLISFEDEEEVKRKQQQQKERRRRSSQLKKSRENSITSTDSDNKKKKTVLAKDWIEKMMKFII